MKVIVWFERTDDAYGVYDPALYVGQPGFMLGWRICVKKLPENAMALELEDRKP